MEKIITPLFETNPELSKEWDFEKNTISPNEVSKGLKIKIWWTCEKGHSYSANITNKVAGSGCPYCSSVKLLKGFNDLKTLYPNIADEWNYEKNGDLFPEMVMGKSGKRVWWKCKNGHEWETPVCKRTSRGNNCPICSGKTIITGVNDLLTIKPFINGIWNYGKNIDVDPSKLGPKSSQKVWWKCDKCGFEWEGRIERTTTSSCPNCKKTIWLKKPSKILIKTKAQI